MRQSERGMLVDAGTARERCPNDAEWRATLGRERKVEL